MIHHRAPNLLSLHPGKSPRSLSNLQQQQHIHVLFAYQNTEYIVHHPSAQCPCVAHTAYKAVYQLALGRQLDFSTVPLMAW